MLVSKQEAQEILKRVETLDSRNVNLVAKKGFTKEIPNNETEFLDEGDKFVIPLNCKVTADKTMNGAEFTSVLVKAADGHFKVVRFYPTSLVKSALEVDPNPPHQVVRTHRAGGSATDKLRELLSVNQFISWLADNKKGIHVTDKELVLVKTTKGDVRYTAVYRYELCDAAECE